MLSLQNPSKTTRRLRVSFDVLVDLQPLSETAFQFTPELALFQKALLEDPALCERMLALQALDKIYRHLGEMYPGEMHSQDNRTGWLPYLFFDLVTAAMGRLSLRQAQSFLVDEMLGCSDLYYTLPLLQVCQARLPDEPPFGKLPMITDLDSGEALDWQTPPPPALLHETDHSAYLVVEIQGQKILALNLIGYAGLEEISKNLDLAAQELADLDMEVQRLLVFITGKQPDLPAEVQDALQVCCQETFPGLPPSVHILLEPGDGSEFEPWTA